jgi:hypothetical protein
MKALMRNDELRTQSQPAMERGVGRIPENVDEES